MEKSTRKLQDFRKWLKRYIRRNYGKKCPDFTWGCAVCHAHFVKDVFDDFVDETIAAEKWSKRQQGRKRK